MQIPTHQELIASIEAFCARYDMADTRFGALATGEPQLLSSLRRGRSPSLKVMTRIASFMARYETESGGVHTAPDTAGTAPSSPDNAGEAIGRAVA